MLSKRKLKYVPIAKHQAHHREPDLLSQASNDPRLLLLCMPPQEPHLHGDS